MVDDEVADARRARAARGPPASGRFETTRAIWPDNPVRSRPRSAWPCWTRGPRSGRRRGDGSSRAQRRPVVRTRSPPDAATTSPMRDRLLAPGASAPSRHAALSAAPTTIMPMPQLKVRSISASATPPVAASQPKTGGTGIASRSSRTPIPSGSTRGMLSGKAAAGDVGERLDAARSRGSPRGAASRRSASARAAPRRGSGRREGRGRVPGQARRARRCGAPARSRSRWTPGGGQAEQHVAGRDGVRQQPSALGRADREAGEVVVAAA